ncbi:hypothetical protein [Pseudoalteromonas ardens]|uniref:Uncharacterized protein n=1 Tax=Pseudoalteromonas rubra TaxID=43658 RepID=A0A0L0ES83_9GAMM|nr:hypothetical protein [Pseudoalteromonas sp. R96]KNC67279.1 hypothetical protein AC626_11750 [Pseudoalteromonas rubra]MDK1312733.1 hypothetical protein [Pseudoalteromonas sp. R96]
MKKMLGLLLLAASLNAAAGNATCRAKVTDVQLNTANRLVASFVGVSDPYSQPMTVKNSGLCTLNGNASEYCQALYSAMLVALTTQNEVTIWFNNTDKENECPSGNYQSLDKKGMYNFRLQ